MSCLEAQAISTRVLVEHLDAHQGVGGSYKQAPTMENPSLGLKLLLKLKMPLGILGVVQVHPQASGSKHTNPGHKAQTIHSRQRPRLLWLCEVALPGKSNNDNLAVSQRYWTASA